MRRREFITLVGGAAAATWPLAAPGQQANEARRVGVLIPLADEDAEGQARLSAFQEGLRKRGWVEGGNIHFVVRWGRGDAGRIRQFAAELAALKLDAILASASPAMAALHPLAGRVPVVFAQVTDPVTSGFVASLARPGGNVTGFTQYEYSVASKWLELLKEIAPWVTRVAVLFDPGQPSSLGYVREIGLASPRIGVRMAPSPVPDAPGLQDAINALVTEQNGGVIVQAGPVTNLLRDRIILLAAQYRLPAIYPRRAYVASGGLASYGVDNIEMYGRAAGYVDRILKGEKAADLPVQQASKFELVINLKTARALGITVPATLLARADEVIE